MSEKVRSEHVEQTIFVSRMRNFYPMIIVAAVPNGGYRTPTEAVRLKAEGVLPGFPDLIVATARHGFHGCYVEMKSQSGRVTKAQLEVHALLRQEGYHVVLGKGADDAFEQVERYLKTEKETNWWD